MADRRRGGSEKRKREVERRERWSTPATTTRMETLAATEAMDKRIERSFRQVINFTSNFLCHCSAEEAIDSD